MAISPSDIRNIAVVGHRGVGKTALVEAMLYLSKALPKMGKQGAWAGGFDATAEEQAHIATLETRPVSVRWHDKKINVFDTPGDTSFFGQTRLALTAADAAILLVSAKDGIQSGTERLFRWLREGKIPTIIAVTKVDDEHANADEVIESIRKVDPHIVQMVVPDGKGPQFKGVVAAEHGVDWPAPDAPGSGKKEVPAALKDAVAKARAKLVDDVAAADDKLTERYLEAGDLTAEELDEGVRKSVAGAQLMPVYLVTSV